MRYPFSTQMEPIHNGVLSLQYSKYASDVAVANQWRSLNGVWYQKAIFLILLWKGSIVLGSRPNCYSSNSRRALAGCTIFWWANYPDWLQMWVCTKQKLPCLNDIIGILMHTHIHRREEPWKTFSACWNWMRNRHKKNLISLVINLFSHNLNINI